MCLFFDLRILIATVVSSDSTSTYNYLCNQCLRRGVLDTTLCDKVAAGLWFSPGTPVSSTNKTDYHDITEYVESGVKHHNHIINKYLPQPYV